MSAFGLSSRIEGLTRKGAQELINAYNKRFPGIEKFSRDAVHQAQMHGYVGNHPRPPPAHYGDQQQHHRPAPRR